MSLTASSCEALPQKRTVSSLLAGRVVKRPKPEDAPRLQEASIQLLEQQQNICGLLQEVGNPDLCNIFRSQNGEQEVAEEIPSAVPASLLVGALRRQASQLGVPVPVLSGRMLLDRLTEVTGGEDRRSKGPLASAQRAQLCVLLESSKQLLAQGALCPKLLWQEYRRDQRIPKLELVYHLHFYNIVTLKSILESDEEVRLWMVSELQALCGWTPPPEDRESKAAQHRVLSAVVGVLVGTGFEQSRDPAAAERRLAQMCRSMLDDMLSWFLDTVETSGTPQSAGAGAERWIEIFDASLCGVSASAEALQRFFTHSLTQTLTYKPRLTVSDAIRLQSEWTFAKASRSLTALFRKLALLSGMERLLAHLRQVLESHEVNWKHVLCFLSALLVYDPGAQPCLTELLHRLLSSAFEGYDLENLITAFLLARQGALEGSAVFPSYSNWFKMSFGGGSSYHATSKKSLVFLLKFLSDLVPFEPPQYLKVHILHPPYVAAKHRGLLMEYVSLAKTRLADLKESVEDMGLYEGVSGPGGASVQCQAVQDVQKAVALFGSTGRISATVMEASIFRRPYFLTRFLPALLTARVLPVKADDRMSFIEALKKADKIPAVQYSSYVESCQKQRHQEKRPVSADREEDPVEVLKAQLQELPGLLAAGEDGEVCAQLSRISHTLSVLFPGSLDEPTDRTVIRLHINAPLSAELHVEVINMILRDFCQCLMDTCRANPPNRQSLWASRFVGVLTGNTQLLSCFTHRLWDLFHNQGSALSPAHVLGLAALLVHLHATASQNPLLQLVPPILPEPVAVVEALSSALVCSTQANMLLCVRLCVSAVCYGICRGDSVPREQKQDYIPSSLYKKLLYLVPRLLPEARRSPISPGGPDGGQEEKEEEESGSGLWSSATDTSCTWRTTALCLWRSSAFRHMEHTPPYQLSISEWLANELRVQRSDDALSDPERQEYQQWACVELYLPRPEEQGGCGGDTRSLCSHLLQAIMDQHHSVQSLQKMDHGASEKGTCLPDILSRLQELVYDLAVTASSSSVCDFLFECVSQRCSTTTSAGISTQLNLQNTLHAWNRVLLALPPVFFIKVKADGGRSTLDCSNMMEHVNQHQRQVCVPAGVLSCHLTSHFLRGLLCAGVRCGRPLEEVNKAWSQISLGCPLLLVSTAHWWERLSPVLLSLWGRLCDGEPLPEQLLLLADCHKWACSLVKGPSPVPVPAAVDVLLAASLHGAWRRSGGRGSQQGFSAALQALSAQRGGQTQVLVLLLFLCVNDYLSSLLYPQEKSHQKARALFTELLPALVDSADWLLIFRPTEQGVYQKITMVTSDEYTRLMPWAFYSLLLQQRPGLLQRALCAPGFLHTALLCYLGLLQLYLDGHAPPDPHTTPDQMEPSQILGQAKQFLLRAISQAPPSTQACSQLRRLEAQCAAVDQEVAAAVSLHLDPPSLSPEMDFL